MKYYTGIGSRNISGEERELIFNIAVKMSEEGYTLRSGGAEGSDTAFEEGCLSVSGELEVYRPTRSPNMKGYHLVPNDLQFNYAKTRLSIDIIPWFSYMKPYSQRIHSRNFYQVVGFDNVCSHVTIYASDEDEEGVKGGTRTAVMVSRSLKIPTYNLRIPEQRNTLLKKIGLA